MHDPNDLSCLRRTWQEATDDVLSKPLRRRNIIPSAVDLDRASSSLVQSIPDNGFGVEKTTNHLWQDVVPGLNSQSLSSSYFGFVTGGVTPAARVAECVVSTFDQNVQVHMPDHSVATTVEDRALGLLLELLHFEPAVWPTRTFTTGATASNILGLACGREHIINQAIKKRSQQNNSATDNRSGMSIDENKSVGEIGLLAACREAGITDIQVLTTMPHSSLKKAASVVGLGRSCLHSVGISSEDLAFDFVKLENDLRRPAIASIVVISCAEVNTGLFATRSYENVLALRSLCDQYGAWLHVDAAFGLFARALEKTPEFEHVRGGTEGLELADSIAGDAHKMLNVPYDCGFFFSRHSKLTQQVLRNPNAAYLNVDAVMDDIASPLNTGLENSRRFRALPVYATLVSYGRDGYSKMLQRQIRFARRLAWYFSLHHQFDLLPQSIEKYGNIDQDIYTIVLFRAKDTNLNNILVKSINETSQIYVSGTIWQDHPASRIAAANWQIEPELQANLVIEVIEALLRDWEKENNG